MRIALIGRTKFLLNTGTYLLKKGIKIELIITSKSAEHDKIKSDDFQNLAKICKAEFFDVQNINSELIQKKLKKMKLDLGISINNPLVVKKEIIDQFKFGILNAHAGDLPKYRGNACPNWAIINDEKEIGLSIHFMTEEIDAGDIILKKKYKNKSKLKISDFYTFAEIEIPKMFFESIKRIETGKMNLKKQDKKKILRTYPRNKSDGKIDWSNSVKQIERLIRASGTPFFGAYTYFDNSKLIIVEAEIENPKFDFYAEPGQVVARNKNGSVSVACNDGFLILKEVIYKNKIFKEPNKIIKTIHTKLGMDIEGEIEKINLRLNEIIKNQKTKKH